MSAISSKRLSPDVRNEIVRDLVTHMYANIDKPGALFVSKVADKLIKTYPFMADSSESTPAVCYVHHEHSFPYS